MKVTADATGTDTPLVVLVCGSRHWTDPRPITARLTAILASRRPLTIVEGGARGADAIAGAWAKQHAAHGVTHHRELARWDQYPPKERWRAGHDRNQAMLDWLLARRSEGAEVRVLAFKAGFDWTMRRGGTEHMLRIAKAAGVPGVVVGTSRPVSLTTAV